MPKIRRITALDPRDLPPALATRGNADKLLLRSLLNFLEVWRYCTPHCRRAHCCVDPKVGCFDPNAERIQEIFADIADWPRFEGPRDPEDEAGPIGELFE
jgi:hypothetical protein